MLTRLLMVLVLTGMPVAAAAQHAAPALNAPVRSRGVTLTVAGYLRPSPAGQLMMPLPLLQQVAGDDALLALDTAPADGRVVVQVRFGFPDLAAFQRWYTDERTVQLLRDIRAQTMGNSFETYVTYRPDHPSATQ
jgi:hypothetical protein